MKVAVIGVGMIGEHHARIYNANPRCELVAVCDTNADRVGAVATSLGCRSYTCHETLFDCEQLDAVSIATPETVRLAPAVAAAEHQLAILLEKPLGRTLPEVDTLMEAMSEANASPAVNFILHADPRFDRMKQIVADGGIGRLVSCFARRRGTRMGIEVYAPWTDLLSSTLIHDIEMVLAVNDAPAERVYAEAVVRECASYGCHDAVVATLRFTNGAIALFETSWVLPPAHPEPLDPAFHVVGDGGLIVIEGASQGMQVLQQSNYSLPDVSHWPTLSDGRVGGALARSLDSFVQATIDGKQHLVGLEEARRAEAVVAAMKKSVEVERPVTLKEV